MRKGDLFSVESLFSDMRQLKRRPALVVAVEASDVTVAFVPSNLSNKQLYDIVLHPSSLNRLKQTSLVRVIKLMTLDLSLIHGRLGELTIPELQQVNAGLKAGLGLS